MRIPYPEWAEGDGGQVSARRSKRLQFLLCLASLYVPPHPDGHVALSNLAKAIGTTPQCLYSAIKRGHLTTPVALLIEKVVGRDVITHEQLLALD